MAALLIDLLKGKTGKTITFHPNAQCAFQCFKLFFTSTPILKLPDPEKVFLVEVYASEVGIGALLLQCQGDPGKCHPCAFFSRKLTLAVHNYDIGNHKLLAAKAVLEEC